MGWVCHASEIEPAKWSVRAASDIEQRKWLVLEVDSEADVVGGDGMKARKKLRAAVRGTIELRVRTGEHTSALRSQRRQAKGSLLRDAFERHDWKVLPTFEVADAQVESRSSSAVDLRQRGRARGAARPSFSRLEASLCARRREGSVGFIWCRSREPLMRPSLVVPRREQRQLLSHGRDCVGDEQATGTAVLDGLDRAFDDRDAAVHADRAKALTDSQPLAPGSERTSAKLPALVGDQMPRANPRLPHDPREELPDLLGGWLCPEDGDSHDAAGEMIDHDGHPPAERPALRPRERKGRGPEPERDRHRREVAPPDVIRIPRDDPSTNRLAVSRCVLGGDLLVEHPSDSCGSQVQSRATKNLGDLRIAQAGTEHLEPLDDVRDEFRERVHGHGHLDDCGRSSFVEALHPRRHRRGLDEKAVCRLGQGPRRTAINTECKLLLLRHAFEDLGANRVTLKADARNVASRRAIERIGGVREGVLRRCISGSWMRNGLR